MRARHAALVALAVGVVGMVVGCLDALSPARAPRVATVAVAPLFGSTANLDVIPADVDSIVITIHNPPAPDITISQRILPGQDSIVITIDVPLANATTANVTMGMEAIRTGPPVEVLYRAVDVPLTIRVGQPTRADTVRATYVGPGAGTLRAITITPRSVVLRPGDSLAFSFTAIDSTGAACCSTMPILWISRATGVAQVSARGIVLARSNGRAWIVATAGASAAIKDSVEVVVATSPVALISFGPSAATFTASAGQANPAPQVVNVTNGGAGTLANLAVTGIQYTSGQPAGWLAATLAAAAAPTTLTLTATTGTLAPGTYSAAVSVASTQASNSPLALPVTFTVSPVPTIGLTPATVTVVDTLTTSDPAPSTVSVANIGTGTLSGLAVGTITYGASQPTNWLTATLGGTTAPATLTLSFVKGTLPVGVYTATVPITSPVGVNSPRNLAVTFDVRPGPAIGLTPASVTFTDTLQTTDPGSQTVNVTNTAGGTLAGLALGTITYGASQPTGWLTASLSGATLPATITLSAAKNALVPGTYTATVPVTSSVASNSPQSLSVTFVLSPYPLSALKVAPGFGVVIPTGMLTLTTTGYNSVGGTVPATGLRYLSRAPAVATVDSLTGAVTGVGGGTTVVVATAPGATGPVSDSTLVAVAASGVAVATPVAGGRAFGAAKVGDTVVVRVLVDLRGVPAEKLGSYNAQLDWVPATLRYVRATAVSGGFAMPTLNETATAAGQLRFGAADPNGNAGPTVGILDITFVADAAGTSALSFALSDLSASSPSYLQMLPGAMVLPGSVRVQ